MMGRNLATGLDALVDTFPYATACWTNVTFRFAKPTDDGLRVFSPGVFLGSGWRALRRIERVAVPDCYNEN
jgi:hypothetical protein